MKKKVLAFLLASTMVIEPFSVASAADFSDGMGQDTVQFSDDVEDVPEVENDEVDQFGTDAVGEGESSSKPSEDAIQMGDDVWVEFDDSTGTVTISGTGDMWDYYEDGWDAKKEHKNPLIDENRVIKHIIISDNITSVSDYLLHAYNEVGSIKQIILGSNIIKIGMHSFENCISVQTINLPKNLKEIGEYAFVNCGLTNLVIPNNVTQIGEGCFQVCNRLESVKISDGLLNIPDGMFSGCQRLSKIELPDSIRKIGNYVFDGCGITSIELPSKLEYVGYGVFQNCLSLQSITLPATIKSIEEGTFRGCIRLSSLIFKDGFNAAIPYSFLKNCRNITSIIIPNGVHQISSTAFENCTKLKEITIPQTVMSIHENAFSGCNELMTIKGYTGSYAETFAKNNGIDFDSIGNVKDTLQLRNAYCEWQGKEHSKINVRCTPNKDVCYYVTYVEKGSAAPDYDARKKDGTVRANNQIYANVTDLPEEEVDIYVFVTDDDGNHISVRITPNYGNRPEKPQDTIFPVKVGENIVATLEGDTLTLTGSGATYDYTWDEGWYNANKSNIKHVDIDGEITRIGDSFFGDFSGLDKIEFPKGIIELGEGVLLGCTGLREIYFPSTLKVIPCFGDGMDENQFPNLETVAIPEGVSTIGEYAFYGCPKLTNVTLPDSITGLEFSSFAYTGITELDLPEKIKNIPPYLLEHSAIKNIAIPKDVNVIEHGAFRGCSNLNEIIILNEVKYIKNDVFEDCRNAYIKGYKDSTAERYALANAIPFVSINYKVIFKDNGRTIPIKNGGVQYVKEGENATPPTLPSKPGYTLSWDADYTNVTEDMVVNAIWTKKDSGNGGGNTTIIVSPSETNKYTVTFKDRGKIVKTEKVKSGDAAEYPFINRNGYELSWDKDFSKVTANITVNAVWTVIKPNKVTSLTTEVQKNSIDLSWDRAENTDYYLVYRKTTSDTEYKQIKKTTKILWTDEDVEPGTEYSYKVVGVCSVDGKKYQSADSDVVTAKIGTPQIGDVYSVGDLNYKLTGTKEVTVTGLAKVTDTLVIPSSVTISGKVYKVTSVQAKAFYRNEDIVNVIIGNNVTYVGKYAFYQCPNLETVKFGKRVSVISTCAFTQCPNLESVILPASVKRLGAKVFYKCNSIRVIQIKSSALEYVGKKGLAGNKMVTLKLPKKVYTKYKELIKASGVYSKTKFVKS